MEKKRVYIVSKSAHDFSPAEGFGELIFLSEGPINRYAVNNMYRHFKDVMEESGRKDYLLLCGLSTMNSVACSIFAHKHGMLNLLLFKQGFYIERNLVFD